MKIERLNDGKIRFTLEAEDLRERDLKIDELNYGSPEAKALFADIVNEADSKFGLDLNDRPLVIEAVPLSDESLIVTVTEVKDLENTAAVLCGTQQVGAKKVGTKERVETEAEEATAQTLEEASPSLLQEKAKALRKKTQPKKVPYFVFAFQDMEALLKAVRAVRIHPKMTNSLYHSESGHYYLVIKPMVPSNTESKYTLSVLSEYAVELLDIPYAKGMVEEHCRCVIKAFALQKMQAALGISGQSAN